MANERTVLICEDDKELLAQLNDGLQGHGFDVTELNDASQLVSEAQRLRPAVVVVDPDMKGYNAAQVCNVIKQELLIPVVLLVGRNSTSRNTIDNCTADDVVELPTGINNLAFILQNQFAIHSKNNKSSDALS